MNTKKEFIKIKIPGWRVSLKVALESFLDFQKLEEWKNRKNEYITFYESIIETLWPDDMDDAEANRKYYKTITYNDEKYDFERSFEGSMTDPNWYDDLY